MKSRKFLRLEKNIIVDIWREIWETDNRGALPHEFSKVLLNFIERIEVGTARRGNNTWNNPSKLANFSKLEPSFAVFEARNKTGTKRSCERKRCRNCGFLLVARWRKDRARNPDRASGDEVLWPTQTRNS